MIGLLFNSFLNYEQTEVTVIQLFTESVSTQMYAL